MAEIFPDEGLDLILSVITGNAAAPANLYMGLFTSQTASTVPARGAVLATQTGVTEASGSRRTYRASQPPSMGTMLPCM